MSGGVDYRGLAARLREVQRRITARTDAAPGPGLPLADVLDHLTSRAGAPLLAELVNLSTAAVDETRAKLAAAGVASTVGAPGQPADAFYPSDPLARGLARFFDEQAGLFGAQVAPEDVPVATVAALCRPANRTGRFTAEDAAALGPRGQQLYAVLAQALAEGPQVSERPATKYEELPLTLAWRVARSRPAAPAKARMPVLDALTRAFGGPRALAGLKMASVQHLFPSTRGLYAALVDNGLAAGTTGVGGKGYSTDMDTMARLASEGFDVHPGGRPMAFRAGASAEAVTLEMAQDQLRLLFAGVDPRQAGPKFLLLDEGAKLVLALHRFYPQYAHLCVAVEQTERGIQLIQDAVAKGELAALACPVVDMARSWAKKRWESPAIGESCVFNLERDLARAMPARWGDPEGQRPKSAAVLGFGAVGEAVAARLAARGYEVHVFDPEPARMAAARAAGHVAEGRQDALQHGHVLFGCSGRGALTPADFEALPDGAVLANAASGNHELGLHDVELETDPQAQVAGVRAHSSLGGHPVDLGEAQDPMRHRIWQTPGGKRIFLARSGYVVNMGLDLPPEYAQLTRGLLLASCLAAAKARTPGFVPIPDNMQGFVVRQVERHLGGREALSAPDFRGLEPW